MRGRIHYFRLSDDELYATLEVQQTDAGSSPCFACTALHLNSREGEWKERGCRSSCSVLTPSPKKNIDSFRNGMGETNEVNDVGAGERGGINERRGEERGFLDDGAGLGRKGGWIAAASR